MTTLLEASELRQTIYQAWEIVPNLPLPDNLTAQNLLEGFHGKAFEQALAEAGRYFAQPNLPPSLLQANRCTIYWLMTLLGARDSKYPPPSIEKGLYSTWQALASAASKEKSERNFIEQLPHDSLQCILWNLKYLGFHKEQFLDFIKILISSLPGWSGRVKALSLSASKDILVDYVAIRVAYAGIYWTSASSYQPYICYTRIANQVKELAEQEKLYAASIFAKLSSCVENHRSKTGCKAQIVFCMDVRSEQLRRAIEEEGYTTYGCAGFFYLPLTLHHKSSKQTLQICPTFVAADIKVIIEDKPNSFKAFVQNIYSKVVGGDVLEALSSNVKKHLDPNFNLLNAAHQQIEYITSSISLEDKCKYAKQFLKISGLKLMSPLTLICGHGSYALNDPYATSLECGACGANKGGLNARIMAKILNEKAVRHELKNRYGVDLPDDSFFLAAEHDTASQEVEIYDVELVPEQFKDDFLELQKSLRAAALLLNPSAHKPFNIPAREKATSNNAGLVIAPRELSIAANFSGEVFLHSYYHEDDLEGAVLKHILTYPLRVAYALNMQYLLASLDPASYGAASRSKMNIIEGIGFMKGITSDLLRGWPIEECKYNKPKLATRLHVIIFAIPDIILDTVKQISFLLELIRNDWIYLYAIEPKNGLKLWLNRNLTWEVVAD